MSAAKAEWRLMLIGIPLFMMANYAGNQYYNQPFLPVAKKIGITFILACAVWSGVRYVRNFLTGYFRGHHQTIRRIAASVLIGGIAGMFLSILLTEPFLFNNISVPSLINHFGPMFFFSVLIVGAHEVLHNFFEMRTMEQEREALKKAHIQSQLDSLKNQINPHFLFNSLNTLSSLVSISPEQAERFIDELSNVYRYLLQSNEKVLTTLRTEIEFVNSYYHLLKTRYGEAIELTISIDKIYFDFLIPSLALQLLLENSTKHNIISATRPLHIHINAQSDPDRLVVTNNLQPKNNPAPSNKMGLANIVKTLQLLNQPEVIIRETENEFIVSLPLIKQW
jgi:two-component system, LytTR family, sensor kinase